MRYNILALFLFLSMSLQVHARASQQAQSVYLHDLPRFVTNKVSNLFERFHDAHKTTQTTYNQQTRDALLGASPKLLTLQEQLQLLASQLPQTLDSATLQDTLNQFSKVQQSQIELNGIQFPLAPHVISQSELCDKHLPSIFLHDFPVYAINEKINPCQRPQPEKRSTAAGKEFRNQAIMPVSIVGSVIASAGCAATFGIGCIVKAVVGAAGGAGVGAAAGEVGRQVIDSQENKKEWEAYNAGCESDKQNQITDIAMAKEFVSKHVIDLETVRKKAHKVCTDHAAIQTVDELANDRAIFLKTRDDLNQAIGDLEVKIAGLKKTIFEGRGAENTQLTDNHHQHSLNRLVELESTNDAISKQRQLIDCLLEAGDSEEEARDCQERAL